jgi:hypothetical protein
MRRPGLVVRITAVGVGVVYAVVLHLVGIRLDQGVKQGLAYLPALAALLLIAWDLSVWRWPLVWKATSRPRLDGLWAVTLHPTSASRIPAEGNQGPIDGYMVVKQTYWTMALRQFTAEGSSVSRAFFWEGSHGTGIDWLTFIYDNMPRQRHQHRSGRHFGTCSLRPGNRRPTEIEGMYFTDRYTQGDLKMTFLGRDTDAGTFDEAARKHADLTAAQQAK